MTIIWNKNIKELTGEVISDKVSTTRIVWVRTVKTHPLYKKRFVVRKKYYAHDEKNESKLWDKVLIRETTPMSKLKRRKLVKVL
jgi:small subunit ribosomal protein S17